jgi:hypothetical protein
MHAPKLHTAANRLLHLLHAMQQTAKRYRLHNLKQQRDSNGSVRVTTACWTSWPRAGPVSRFLHMV